MEFAPVVLAPGQSVQYVVRFGMTGNETTLPQILAACDTAEKAETILVEVKKHWQEQVNVSFETGSREKDNYLRWICFQPILRRIYGCSFLPYHDYGKGGRGWRDLWQDCLALLIMNPSGVRQMIVDNYAGVRLDGTNATIIGEKQGEFVADRNNITRVWMDHAFWPLLTTEFYLNQTGDLKILLEKAPYFKDKQIWQCGDYYTKHQGQYPVIFLTFKDVKSMTWEETFQKIRRLISLEFIRHNELETSSVLTAYEKEQYHLLAGDSGDEVDCQMGLQLLSLLLHKHYGRECIIIIDEYDTPCLLYTSDAADD